MDDIDLLQLHTYDDALRDEGTKAAIDAIIMDNYRNPEQKSEGILHFKEAIRLIETVVPVFDTMESHYDQLQKIGIDQPLPPRPAGDDAFRPDLFVGEIRGKIDYYNSIMLTTVGNLELYGELQDLTLVFNAMVEVYMQNRHKMNEMSGRIKGSSDRYTALYKDLAVLRTHIVELAKTLEFYCKHYPKDEMPNFSEARKDPLELQRKILLLKHFKVFENEEEEEKEREIIVIEDEEASLEKAKDKARKNEIKLMSMEGAISISQLLQDIAISAARSKPKLATNAMGLKVFWESPFGGQKIDFITTEDRAEFPALVGTLEAARRMFVQARGLVEPPDIGTRIDINIDRINETLEKPSVTMEEARRGFKEALGRAAERIERERIRDQREIRDVEALIKEEEAKLEDAKRKGKEKEVDRLNKEVKALRTQVDRLKEKEKIATSLADSGKREQLAADVVAIALGGNTAKPLRKILASGDTMMIIVAGVTVGFLLYARGRFLTFGREQSNRKKRRRE